MNRLFVLGNGFDILHNLKTSYKDFFEFSEKYYTGMLDELIEYFDHLEIEENWCDFEDSLSYLNDSKISEQLRVSKFGNLTEGIKSVEVYFQTIKEVLDYLFYQWAFHISNNELNDVKSIFSFRETDEFISFNYTELLENTYSINLERILHIHGSSRDDVGSLVYGHNNRLFYEHIFEVTRLEELENNLEFDAENELSRKIAEETMKITKPVDRIINSNVSKLNVKYDEVVFIGHSYSKVDVPYLNFIIDTNKTSKIVFHCHDKKTESRLCAEIDINKLTNALIIDTSTIYNLFSNSVL